MQVTLSRPNLDSIQREAARARRFMERSESARREALGYHDARFFSKLAYQEALVAQVGLLEGVPARQTRAALAEAGQDFATALELGYLTDVVEISNWFYRALAIGETSAAHFFAAVPASAFEFGPPFARLQFLWGSALFRGEEGRAIKYLEVLYGLCFEEISEAKNEEEQWKLDLAQSGYTLMNAISHRDVGAFTLGLNRRAELWRMIPPEGIRYERYQPFDLIALGYCRLACLCGIPIPSAAPSSIPIVLLDAMDSVPEAQNGPEGDEDGTHTMIANK